jgi:DNA primase
MNRHLNEWQEIVVCAVGGHRAFARKAFPICPLDGRVVVDILEGGFSDKKSELYFDLANRAVQYLVRRGMDRGQIEQYRVYVKEFDPRVYFPFWESGEITFWMGRTIDDTVEPKTLNSDEAVVPLFGRHVKHYRKDVVLVEGVFDHIVTPRSYALMGSGISPSQIEVLIKDKVERVFIILDADAGTKSVNIAKKLGDVGIKAYPCISCYQYYTDPADAGRERMVNAVKMLIDDCPVRPQRLLWA